MSAGPQRPQAFLSCDVDPVDRHLQGYGFEGVPPTDLVYRVAVPRILELLDEIGVPATFFVLGRDALAQADLLREMVARGHEVASHSWGHPQPFHTLGDTSLVHELEASRAVLEHVTGRPCEGFRAPAWDIDERVLAAIVRAGYRYDASLFPTPLLLLSRASVFVRGLLPVRSNHAGGAPSQERGGKGDVLSMSVVHHAFASSVPHRLSTPEGPLLEIPASVSPLSRLPLYQTFAYLVPRPLFAAIYADVRRSGRACSYEFHAADLLDRVDDDVDPRMACHPGMSLSLGTKRAVLRQMMERLARDYDVVPLRQARAS